MIPKLVDVGHKTGGPGLNFRPHLKTVIYAKVIRQTEIYVMRAMSFKIPFKVEKPPPRGVENKNCDCMSPDHF